jgi:predicted FMN-binding regulatory protein PaiB
MYTPRHFEVRDEALILEIIEAYPFVILVSLDESGSPFFRYVFTGSLDGA